MRPAKTATVHVCALRHLPDMIEQTGARHLVSAVKVGSDGAPPPPPIETVMAPALAATPAVTVIQETP